MMEAYSANVRRVFWYVLAGTKGGLTRIRIIDLLKKRPYNTNQLSESLKMDYKTIQHHIKVLEDNKIITYEQKKYGTMYFTTQLFNQYAQIYDEIKEKLKEKEK